MAGNIKIGDVGVVRFWGGAPLRAEVIDTSGDLNGMGASHIRVRKLGDDAQHEIVLYMCDDGAWVFGNHVTFTLDEQRSDSQPAEAMADPMDPVIQGAHAWLASDALDRLVSPYYVPFQAHRQACDRATKFARYLIACQAAYSESCRMLMEAGVSGETIRERIRIALQRENPSRQRSGGG